MNIIECFNKKAGLGIQFKIECKNKDCKLKINHYYFHTTKKQGQTYQVNQNAVSASRIIGEGCTGLLKFCPVLGLSSPINKHSYSEYTKYLENLVQELWRKLQIICGKNK